MNRDRKLTPYIWLSELFQDERGHISIKPVIALMGSVFLCSIMLLGAVYQTEFKPAEYIVNAVMVITIMGMGGDTIDKFSLKKPETTEIDPNLPNPNR
jgi:hypothetical protein